MNTNVGASTASQDSHTVFRDAIVAVRVILPDGVRAMAAGHSAGRISKGIPLLSTPRLLSRPPTFISLSYLTPNAKDP